MSVTRRVLRAHCIKLQSQLDASGHESRKNRAAKLRKVIEINEGLQKRIDALSAENDNLRAKLEEAKG